MQENMNWDIPGFPAVWIFSINPRFDGRKAKHNIPHPKELLDHNDVKTTMIYTYVLNRGSTGVMSPIDGL